MGGENKSHSASNILLSLCTSGGTPQNQNDDTFDSDNREATSRAINTKMPMQSKTIDPSMKSGSSGSTPNGCVSWMSKTLKRSTHNIANIRPVTTRARMRFRDTALNIQDVLQAQSFASVPTTMLSSYQRLSTLAPMPLESNFVVVQIVSFDSLSNWVS